MPAEIDTSGLIRAAFRSGKRVAAPRMEGGEIVFAYLDESWESLPRDALGIPTPPAGVPIPAAGLRRLDVFALIPGLLFDRAGGRLGRGKGYYDRFLSSVLRNLGADDPVGTEPVHEGLEKFFVPCGFCYQAQVVGRVPLTGRDVRVPLIATEAGIIRA